MKNKTMKNKTIIAIAVVCAVVAILSMVYFIFSEKTTEGQKDITIEVVNSAGESAMYKVNTDAEYLRQAMDEAEGLEYSGEESEYGLMVTTVNGEVADYNANGAYWAFNVNGSYCNYGIDSQPVNDGDEFQIVYTK